MAKKLVKMQRDGKTADVHPKEVENYQQGGYELVAPKKKSASKPETKEESTTPNRCLFIKKNKQQCGNDALEKSDFCHEKSHK